MPAEVTPRELLRRFLQVIAFVLIVLTGIGYAAAVPPILVAFAEVLVVACGLIMIWRFSRRSVPALRLDRPRAIYYFIVVPLIMGALSGGYLLLRLPPWPAVIAFPLIVFILNELYFCRGNNQDRR